MKKPLKLTTYQLLIVRFCMNIYVCQKRVEFYAPTNFFIYINIYHEQVKKTNSSSNNFFHICWAKKTIYRLQLLELFCLQTRIFPCVSRFPSFKIDNKNISWNPRLGAQKKIREFGSCSGEDPAFFLGGKCPSPLKRREHLEKRIIGNCLFIL